MFRPGSYGVLSQAAVAAKAFAACNFPLARKSKVASTLDDFLILASAKTEKSEPDEADAAQRHPEEGHMGWASASAQIVPAIKGRETRRKLPAQGVF